MFAKLIFWYVSFFWQSVGTSETGKSGNLEGAVNDRSLKKDKLIIRK